MVVNQKFNSLFCIFLSEFLIFALGENTLKKDVKHWDHSWGWSKTKMSKGNKRKITQIY